MAARANGFTVHSRLAVTERVGASVAASGRPRLMALIRQLQPRDRLIVYTLDGLGRDAADILKTVHMIVDRGAEPYCTSLSPDVRIAGSTPFVAFMEAMAAFDQLKVNERKEALGRGVKGGRLGRAPSLDEATQKAVCADLRAGDTIAAVARRYNTSRQTIMRVRDKTPNS
ncbi:recombinase family protein [Tateyamaria sp. SN6-1]|uniref:recombinase family protein n=1 Tax=Tateyamaria sp. SN6-1 TaxID=3092148 RepID=UPI0039F53909